jgi:hypothetical protein
MAEKPRVITRENTRCLVSGMAERIHAYEAVKGATDTLILCKRCYNCLGQKKPIPDVAIMFDAIPPELSFLTPDEARCCARVAPLWDVYKTLPGGQKASHNGVIHYAQDLAALAAVLPPPADAAHCKNLHIKVRSKGSKMCKRQLVINPDRVRRALQVLQQLHPHHADVPISAENLATYKASDDACSSSSSSGISAEPRAKNPRTDATIAAEDNTTDAMETLAFVDLQDLSTANGARNAALRHLLLEHMEGPLQDYKTPDLMTICFPTLFPTGRHGPGSHPPSAAYVRHCLRYFDRRFATNPTWCFGCSTSR